MRTTLQRTVKAVTNFFVAYKGFTPTSFNRKASTSALFDGWDAFIHDTAKNLRNQTDAFEFVSEQQSVNYEINLRAAIAQRIKERIGIEPDPLVIKNLEHTAAMDLDYERQLAYNVYRYEEQLSQTVEENRKERFLVNLREATQLTHH
jgi:primosomal protein N''